MLAIQKGWQSHIAYGRGNRPSRSQTFRIGSDLTLYANAISARLFDNDGFSIKRATRQLIEHIKFISPDVVHLHNLHGYYLNTALLFKYLSESDIPVLWTLHDCWPMTGHCTYFDHVQCGRWKTGCFSCPQKTEYPASLIVDNSKNNFLKKKQIFTGIRRMQLVTPSIWLAGLVKQSFLAGYPVRVINNGVDLNVFRPRPGTAVREKYGLGPEKIILGVASIWDDRKGLRYFTGLEKLLSENEKIVLVGLSRKQIEQLPVGITGVCRTENLEELAALYSLADVFVSPSTEETFGLTTAEAMACGTPVVVFNATASPELVSPETGLVVPKENISMLYDAITEILRNGRESYQPGCIARARKLYNSTDRCQDYFSSYTEVAGLLNESIQNTA